MNPQSTFCPNYNCSSRGKQARGNIIFHDVHRDRLKCLTCGKTFRATQGTLFHGKKYPPETILSVVTLLAFGCPIQAIVHALYIDERTVKSWQKQAGEHCEKFHEEKVLQSKMDLKQVQADEMYVKLQKRKVVWMAMAMCATTRLWLGGIVSASRNQKMLQKLANRVKSCSMLAPILLITDGFSGYVKVWKRAFSDPERTGKRGRPALIERANVVIAQMVKQYERGHVVGIDERLIQGKPELLASLLGEGRKISTAYIERINATFRSRCHELVRRVRGQARKAETITACMYLVGCLYNFCKPHTSLSKKSYQTPAMAAGLTNFIWSVENVMRYRFAPPPYVEPKKRGRKPKIKDSDLKGGEVGFTG